jgi:phosphopantetheinyl transferase (holo-ACP synthase)
MDPAPAAVLYDRYSFHGPRYHSNKKTVKIGSRGIAGHAHRREGRGSLLDIMGQTIGLFLHLTQTRNTISFPVRLKELDLYADIFDQDGTFEYTMLVTHLAKSSIAADVVLRRDGRIWSVARDFVCQRFENHPPLWHAIRRPQHSKLAEEIAPDVYFYSSTSQGNVLTLLSKRYLNGPDRAEAERFKSTSRVREHLISRIVLKDAVRDFVRKHAGAGGGTDADTGADEMLYPIEIVCDHDEKGRLLVRGYGRAAKLLDGIHVSLSHKGDESAAIVAREPVGIDLERIEEKGDGFRELAFTERERELLAPLRQPEASIRFWVAKEACAKKAGTGLEGDPRRFEVSTVDDDLLSVGDQKVEVVTIGEEHVIGWTI